MNVTLKDIANELDLSINTVSRALRDMPDVNRDTKKLIRETAQRMGYRKNLAASRLRTKRSNMLGLVLTDFENPAMSQIIRGADDIAKRTGYTLMVGCSNENAEDEEAVVSKMLAQGIDGLLILPSMLNEKLLDQIESEDVPYVLAVRKYEGRRSNIVRSDDLIGAAAVAEHLYQLGHRQFLYVCGLKHSYSALQRYLGFLNKVREYGLDRPAVDIIDCDGSCADAQRVMQEWLSQQSGNQLPVTAVFAFSDYVACGVYAALQGSGLRVPEDISIVGYDNNEFSSLITPQLTTVDNHLFEQGRQSAIRLLNLINRQNSGMTTEAQERISAPELIIRASTAPPPEALPYISAKR